MERIGTDDSRRNQAGVLIVAVVHGALDVAADGREICEAQIEVQSQNALPSLLVRAGRFIHLRGVAVEVECRSAQHFIDRRLVRSSAAVSDADLTRAVLVGLYDQQRGEVVCRPTAQTEPCLMLVDSIEILTERRVLDPAVRLLGPHGKPRGQGISDDGTTHDTFDVVVIEVACFSFD